MADNHIPRRVRSGLRSNGQIRYACPIPGCFVTFSRKYDIRRHHVAQHTDNPPRFPCEASDCNYVSTTKSNLKAHVRTQHQNVRGFTCPDCNTFHRYMFDLRRHQRVMHPRSTMKQGQYPRSDSVLRKGVATGQRIEDEDAQTTDSDDHSGSPTNSNASMETASPTPTYAYSTSNGTTHPTGNLYDNSVELHIPATPALTDAPTPASLPFGTSLPATPNMAFANDVHLATPALSVPFHRAAAWPIYEQYPAVGMPWGTPDTLLTNTVNPAWASAFNQFPVGGNA